MAIKNLTLPAILLCVLCLTACGSQTKITSSVSNKCNKVVARSNLKTPTKPSTLVVVTGCVGDTQNSMTLNSVQAPKAVDGFTLIRLRVINKSTRTIPFFTIVSKWKTATGTTAVQTTDYSISQQGQTFSETCTGCGSYTSNASGKPQSVKTVIETDSTPITIDQYLRMQPRQDVSSFNIN